MLSQSQPPMTTSSILGSPPVSLMYNIQMQVGSSILGTGPPVPPNPTSFTPGRVIPSSSVVNSPQAPPPPPPPPPGAPPIVTPQPSILGNPPARYLMPQNVGPSRPHNPSGYTGPPFDSNVPPPIAPMGPGGFNQGPQYAPPHQMMGSRDEQFSSLITAPHGMGQAPPGVINYSGNSWPPFEGTATNSTVHIHCRED